MYTVRRDFFRYGRETDSVDITTKEFEDEEKAIAYAHRYAYGRRFVAAYVEDENGDIIYEILNYGADIYDNRKRGN